MCRTPQPHSGAHKHDGRPAALFLMNGPFARTAAKKLASQFQKCTDARGKLDVLFVTLFARLPTDDELALATAFLAKGPEADRWEQLPSMDCC